MRSSGYALVLVASIGICSCAATPNGGASEPSPASADADTPPTPVADTPDPSEAAPAEATAPARPPPPTCDALPGWRYERIDLPPEFAPKLPPGVEVLWFAPGMFEAAAPDYFTYAFSVTWEGDAIAGREALEGWLHGYYDGLMTAVAGASDRKPARPVQVTLAEDARSGTVATSDEFTGAGDLDIALRIAGDDECMRVYATARPTEENWTALSAADACLCGAVP